MQTFFILLIVLAIVAVVIYFLSKSFANGYNYDTNYSSYGGSKKYKNAKYTPCMPIHLNIVLALIFAYIVYAMFYN